ncbi:MAG: polysaccharide deacetylase [Halioglobus sp.]|nr:polysaccharide deacetylase [Halioglobus sp.]
MKLKHPTQVCITIDTEFSIAGHFQNPQRNQPVAEPMVFGNVAGREEALGFLLNTFSTFNIRASFFIECANYYFFGDEPMQTVVKRIQSAGQDIQLHIHPVWLSFAKGALEGRFPQDDHCTGRNFADLQHAFELCIAVFERWVGHQPLAVRTGSLRADNNIYRVMASLGLTLSSNIATGIFTPDDPLLQLNSGRHNIHGVTEIPVFTYQDMNVLGRKRRKSLQITSCSWPEMRYLLRKARSAGIETVVILTHPSEFIKKSDFSYSRLTRNRVNQGRLSRLCEFIANNPAEFESVDFSEQADFWRSAEVQQHFITVPTHYALARMAHNFINDRLWHY